MSTVRIQTAISITDSDSALLPLETMKSVTYASKEDKEFVIAGSTEKTIYNPTVDSSEATSDFDLLILKSSGDCEIELFCDSDNDVGKQIITLKLIKDIPFFLGSNVSRANPILSLTVQSNTITGTGGAILGATSGATATVVAVSGLNLYLKTISGLFEAGETLTVTSGDLAGLTNLLVSNTKTTALTVCSQNYFSGTADVIDKIIAKAGSAAITLRMLMFT